MVINQRRNMIAYVNDKYGQASKLFLEVLTHFKQDPNTLLTTPNQKVKQLISETLDKYYKEQD